MNGGRWRSNNQDPIGQRRCSKMDVIGEILDQQPQTGQDKPTNSLWRSILFHPLPAADYAENSDVPAKQVHLRDIAGRKGTNFPTKPCLIKLVNSRWINMRNKVWLSKKKSQVKTCRKRDQGAKNVHPVQVKGSMQFVVSLWPRRSKIRQQYFAYF
jgi:hypothetical protein